jgi:methyl-accepting chemotaxis protein
MQLRQRERGFAYESEMRGKTSPGSPHLGAARLLRNRTPTVFVPHPRAPARVKIARKAGFGVLDLLMRLIDPLTHAAAVVGLTVAAFWVALRFFGEKLFGHWLEKRLQSQKEAHEFKLEEFKREQNEELEDLKGAQNEKIEKLRGDIGHLQDRGKHSNEREYAALAEIWEKFSDLHTATNNCIMGFMQFPDLERMDNDRIARFLDQNDFTEDDAPPC